MVKIKAQNKCCENKSPRAGTHDHAQDADGVWVKKKKSTERQRALQRSVCVFVRVWEICLKWPCASSSLEGSRSCDGSRPVSSLCSCCSVMLLALKHTNTRLCVNSRHRSTGHPCALAKHRVCFQCPRLASKTAPLPDGGFTGKQAGSVSKINTAGGDATLKDTFCWFYVKSLHSAKYSCAPLFVSAGSVSALTQMTTKG